MAKLIELGSTGLNRSGGIIGEEFLTILKGQKGRKYYAEMASNSWVAGVILLSISKMLQRLEWQIESIDPDDPQAVEIAEYVETCRTDMTDTWDVTLTEIMTMLTYGWSWNEVVYKRRGGPSKNPARDSQHDDGRIGWRKWAPRSQDTLQKWWFDDDGDIAAMQQMDMFSGKGIVDIPIERSLLFRFDPVRGNPEGKSLLRNAVISYFHAKRIKEIEGIGVERDLAGLPVAYVPQEWMADNATADNKAAFQAVKDIVEGVKRNEKEGVLLPTRMDVDGKIHKIVELELLTTGGTRQMDVGGTIARYDREIASSVLMDFLLLGHEAVGSKALGDSKIDLWMMSVDAIARSIAETINRHAIPKLVGLNGWDVKLSPKLTYGTVEKSDLVEIAEYIDKLVGSSTVLPDEGMEDWARETFGFPMRVESRPETPEPEIPDVGLPEVDTQGLEGDLTEDDDEL